MFLKDFKIRYFSLISLMLLFSAYNTLLCAAQDSSNVLPYPATPADAESLQSNTAYQINCQTEMDVPMGENVNMRFVLIPAGEFNMGSQNSEKKRKSDEGPVHHVKISQSFYMGKYEVAQIQYNTLMGKQKNSKYRGDNLPVENINFYEITDFLSRLSIKYNTKFRLPTEAEWEYACRAGTSTPFYTGETIKPNEANYDCRKTYGCGDKGRYNGMTSAIGSYSHNAFGLYDMHGNVWEWCSDIYAGNYYNHADMKDPKGAPGGKKYVIRGGSWKDDPSELRSSNRKARRRGADNKRLGFRVVMEISDSKNFENHNVNVIVPGAIQQKWSPPQVVAQDYNDTTKKGFLTVDMKDRSYAEVREWTLKTIDQFCASKNLIIEQGKRPEGGAAYQLTNEKVENGKLTIEFIAVH